MLGRFVGLFEQFDGFAFRLIGLGLATHQIGDTMKLSPKTLETYRDRIRSKLNLNSGTEMSGQSLIWIMENG